MGGRNGPRDQPPTCPSAQPRPCSLRTPGKGRAGAAHIGQQLDSALCREQLSARHTETDRETGTSPLPWPVRTELRTRNRSPLTRVWGSRCKEHATAAPSLPVASTPTRARARSCSRPLPVSPAARSLPQPSSEAWPPARRRPAKRWCLETVLKPHVTGNPNRSESEIKPACKGIERTTGDPAQKRLTTRDVDRARVTSQGSKARRQVAGERGRGRGAGREEATVHLGSSSTQPPPRPDKGAGQSPGKSRETSQGAELRVRAPRSSRACR